ncbi:DNA replication factor C, large subunit [Sistotremastrum suecicum HHB10207 ss-3]|uniref:Replication factor C subunit 1 n=1 Tax=Sistotremastrum suecicum HHB10207 ss-3 TaxID=1314776 RepID=A0A166DN89_9AGAM|nr:DNA replication factor C, large subunit [Sistotremastrum suecicum HHB10207 ss-3]
MPATTKATHKPSGSAPSADSPSLKHFFKQSASQPKASSQDSTAIDLTGDEDRAGPSNKSTPGTSPATPAILKATKLKSEAGPEQTTRKAPSSTKRKAAVISDDESDLESPPKKKASTSKVAKTETAKAKPRKSHVISSDEDEEDSPPAKKVTKKPPKKASRKDDDFIVSDGSEIEEKPKKKTPKKAAKVDKPAPKKKATEDNDPLIDPPKPKFNYAAKAAKLAAGPSAPGSKEVPVGQPNCLAGLAFVFTGELTSLAREEAQDLAKRYGGRVTLQPSSKTSYVILGNDAGPKKLEAIKKHGLPTLDEDGFLELIRTRKGVLDEATKKKMQDEERKIKEAAKDLELREKAAAKEAAKPGAAAGAAPSGQLWTTKYAPQTLKEICGNKGQVEKLQKWLHDWPSSLKSGFKKPGKDGMNIFRAVMITGPPGIGKTTSAHLCAKLEGYTPIELNASDARSKKLVESSTNINNTSLDGFLVGDKKTNVVGMEITNKTVLIMDEVDGMSAGDRGGIGALNALIRKSRIPIICIANDRTAQKMKPLTSTTFNLPFRRPEAAAIRSRIKTIAYKEKLDIPANVVDQLVNGTQSDIRQVLNMLSTWKLSSNSIDFDQGKELSKSNEKYVLMTPFNVTFKILGPYLFSSTARETLNEKMELYFHDMSLVPLFIQENYLKTEPAKCRGLDGPELAMKRLELMDRAASSISDGDLVDNMIHSSEQHWSLLPLHAALSTIRPSSFLFGTGGGYGSPNPQSFPAWLGQNSRQSKLKRQLGDIQIRMRLKVSGDKVEIRQHYIPALFPRLVMPLMESGASAVDEVIESMDEYFLSREDWDSLVELGVGDHKDETVLKKISTATKTSFTRKYNTQDHPIPFHKATDLGKVPKKLGDGPAPDHEDVFDVDDDVEEEDTKESKDVDSISKDKLIKESKPKGKAKAKTSKKD